MTRSQRSSSGTRTCTFTASRQLGLSVLSVVSGLVFAAAGCSGDPKTEDTGPPVEIAAENLIDDFEDGDGSILERSMRSGFWYTYKDPTVGAMLTPDDGAAVVPEAGGANNSGKAVHYYGSGFKEWGAGLGFQFIKIMNNAPLPYDVGAFTGIAFTAKSRGAVPLRVSLGVVDVLPASEGGTCVNNAAMTNCHDVHGLTVNVGEEWKQYKVPFSRLAQEGYGLKAAWDPTKVISAGFDVGPTASFDVWIDDVGFYK